MEGPMFSRSISMRNMKRTVLVTMLLSAALLLCFAVPLFAAGIKVVPSSLRVSAGDAFLVDIVAENIPSEGLGAVQFKLNIDAQGSPVSGVADTSLGSPTDISIATPLTIGPSTTGRSGLGDFFWNATGPSGILVMDNENLLNNSALFTYGHTNGSTPPSGSGSVARFQFVVGKDVAAKKITITLSEVMLLDSGTEYSLEANAGAVVDVGCGAVVPSLIGLSLQEAQTALQSAGLIVGNVFEIDNPNGSLQLNKVLQQTPAAGIAALCDSSVNLAINTAPSEVTQVTASDKTGDQTGTVVLSWVPSVSSDTAGYRIYRLSGTPGLMIEIRNPAAAGAEITGLPNGQATHLKITVFDTFNNESQGVAVSATPLDDVAPTVHAVPAGGTFTAAISVTLEANELADIFYTTDNSAPTINSLRYSVPIVVAASATLKFLAVDRAGNASQIMTETYTVRSSTITVHVETSKARQLAGLKVYLFKENGTYTNVSATTDASGNAAFNVGSLTSGNYKFRVDYLGYQFWSGVLNLPGSAQTMVLIAEETAEVTLSPAVSGVKVYLFTSAGSYMNISGTSDSSGKTSYNLPVGKAYKFRADYLGSQYWSPVVTVAAGGTNPVAINLGGGTLTLTVQKQAGSPMAGVKTYLFNNAGAYLNQTLTTDAGGVVRYNVTGGTYRVRVDYLGYQFWSSDTAVSSDAAVQLNIPHRTVSITVNGSFQGTNTPLVGITGYLFTSAGTYLNISKISNSSGIVTIELPQKDYKVRADYLGQQFWSSVFNSVNSSLNIAMSDARISVTGNGMPLQGVKVYVFSAAGSYLNVSGTTDSSGMITFRLPAGAYKFRADYQAKQFWSMTESLAADEVKPIGISTGGGSFTLHLLKDQQTPLAGVKSYVFNEGGPYLNMNGITDAEGKVSFGLADGNCQFRIDHLGYQFWTDVLTVPAVLDYTQIIEHRDSTITVQGQLSTDISPISNVKVYLFSPSGAYLSREETTDLNGHVLFSLPQKSYMVRADYLGQQFWSTPFMGQDALVNIPEGIARVHVNMTGQDIAGAIVYVYGASGSYLNLSGTTDMYGIVEFRLPAGSYTFRSDYQGQQFRVSAGVAEHLANEIEVGSVGAAFGLNIDTGSGPLAGARVYVFSAAGSYLGIFGDTDASGRISFNLVDGSFKFRVDHLGYQYWTDAILIPNVTQHAMTILHRDTAVTVQGLLGSDAHGLSGLPVYLYSPSGSYLGQKKDTDTDGRAFFFLPDAEYKLRADYLGVKFWSDIFRFIDPVITINEGIMHIFVNRASVAVPGAKVYLFSDTGSYLGQFRTTDSLGIAEFVLPDKNFKFRIDEGGKQYWSGLVEVVAGQVNELGIDLDSYGP